MAALLGDHESNVIRHENLGVPKLLIWAECTYGFLYFFEGRTLFINIHRYWTHYPNPEALLEGFTTADTYVKGVAVCEH